ncbi:MAG: helix-turn-helix transcriptional regulator [Halobacteriales archaeon]|nr:helix-turn-helix transcriptional regulator [Halobacteriales archaeon]
MENRLKVYRAKKEITQEELADRVDVSRQAINSVETGKYDPSLELAFKLADEFDCRIEDLFDYDGEED